MVLKLTYFTTRGLGEPIRLLLTDNRIPFEDQRILWANWAALKPKMIFGQIPCLLTEDGTEISQTSAILHHLARVHNLNGQNEKETTFIDMFYEGVRDLHSKYANMIYNDYENGKEPFIKDVLPGQLGELERLLKTHENGEKFVAGDHVSFVDYVLFEELDVELILDSRCLDMFPVLKAFHGRFGKRPKIKEYIAKRNTMNVNVNGNGKQ